MPVDFAALRDALRDDLESVGQDEWNAYCPAHDDGRKNRERSLSIRQNHDGTATLYCHAGCSFRAILSALHLHGTIRNDTSSLTNSCGTQNNTDYARRIWRQAQDATGTVVETYLRVRGITLPPPATLRFHPRLKHKESGTFVPAMVAAITVGDNRNLVAVHRTFLKADGSSRLEPKKVLGSARGGSVHLAPVGRRLALTEGIETALSVQQATGLPVWAALSTSNLPNVVLPSMVEEVVIAADNDENGAGLRAARKAADRFIAVGKRVYIMVPRAPGADYNDVLRGKGMQGMADE